jgi:hypothetical protein
MRWCTSEWPSELLLRSLWSGFRVPNGIRSAVFGRLYVCERYSTTVRVILAVGLSCWRALWIACTEVMQRRRAYLCIDIVWWCQWWLYHWWWDGMRWRVCGNDRQWHGECKRRNVGWLGATDNSFVGKDKTKWGKVKGSTHIRRRRHNYPGCSAKQGKPLGSSKHGTLITDEMLDNIVQHTIQYILIQPNFSRASDAKLTDKFIQKLSCVFCV